MKLRTGRVRGCGRVPLQRVFNWLFAQHHARHGDGGEFSLRIEDTDRKRYSTEAVDAIYEGLNWLGLKWDGAAVSQFSRIEKHKKAVAQLLEEGKAYRCYCTPDELNIMRAEARKAGHKRM